jgi:hypothetical protein
MQELSAQTLSLAETAALLVAAQNELEELNFNPVTTVGAARENDIGFLTSPDRWPN